MSTPGRKGNSKIKVRIATLPSTALRSLWAKRSVPESTEKKEMREKVTMLQTQLNRALDHFFYDRSFVIGL